MKPDHATKIILLQTALDLIWESSYGSVSVDEICKRAGVQKGSFYHFFPSKSDLAVAAFEHYWQEFRRPQLDRVFSIQTPPLERLLSYCDQLYENQVERFRQKGKVCGCPFNSIGSELSTQDEQVRLKAQEISTRVCSYIASALREAVQQKSLTLDVDPMTMARELYSQVTGVLLQARIHNDLQIVKGLRSTFQHALGLRRKTAAA
jgi:TetR/AcrR family transcriptional regulator, transcriptional repressor for nem operon